MDSVRIFSPTGYLQTVQYGFNQDIPTDFVLTKDYYSNGNLRGITMSKDTLVIIDNYHIYADKWEAYYHQNGVLRTKGYFTKGLMVGQWPVYDSLNCLIEEKICVPVGYDVDKSYRITKDFYPNGKVKSEKKYSYFAEDDYPIGTWKYYDESGKLIRTEKH